MENEGSTPITRYVILDSNILSRAASRPDVKVKISAAIIEHMRWILAQSPGWGAAISAATVFEMTDRSTLLGEIALERAIEGMKIFDIDMGVLRCAGRLGSFYKNIGMNDGQISSMDKIIAATAVLTGSVIYTTDLSDYPAPFFSEARPLRKIIEYEVKKAPIYLPTYFVVPESETIQKYIEQRKKPVLDGSVKKSYLEVSAVSELLQESPTAPTQQPIKKDLG